MSEVSLRDDARQRAEALLAHLLNEQVELERTQGDEVVPNANNSAFSPTELKQACQCLSRCIEAARRLNRQLADFP